MPHSNLDPTKQWTLQAPIAFSGSGLHTGEFAQLRMLPAPVGHGIVFVRGDMVGRPRIPALVEFVSDTTLSTSLARGRATIRTVEHLLAAVYGMGVTNALIAVSGPEIPALDGSALAYTRAIIETGRVAQAADRLLLGPANQLAIEIGDRSLQYRPGKQAAVSYVVDYGHQFASIQCWKGIITPAVMRHDLAPARTFCLKADAEQMQAMGLARGGNFENAVVVMDDGYSSPLRFSDEFVRHKVLDLLGDLALIGATWHGQIVAAKAGHPLHVQLAEKLRPFVLNANSSRSRHPARKVAAYAC